MKFSKEFMAADINIGYPGVFVVTIAFVAD
jgi:hypothetical protein